jgi:hypothetical protein
LLLKHGDVFSPLPAASAAMLKRLVSLGIIGEVPDKPLVLLPLLEGNAPESQRLSLYQKGRLTTLNADLLARAIPGVVADSRPFITDFRIARPKDWRDVYQYTPQGALIGWRRYAEGKTFDFTAEGLLITARDARGRCAVASAVDYQLSQPNESRSPWDWAPMRFTPSSRTIRYAYADDNDLVGKPLAGAEQLPNR